MTDVTSKVWYTQKHMNSMGLVLTTIGVGVAIIYSPVEPILSLFLFALIGSFVILTGYRLRTIRSVFARGFKVTAWIYVYVSVGFSTYWLGRFSPALLIDSLKIVTPIEFLGTAAFAWFGRKKLSPDHKFVSAFNKVVVYTLFIVTPFTIGGIHDYNIRGDTSPPQIITMKIVGKSHILSADSEDMWWVEVEGLDGNTRFSFVSESYYELEIGSLLDVRIRRGALGYSWWEGYVNESATS